jgi:hypothetical protein
MCVAQDRIVAQQTMRNTAIHPWPVPVHLFLKKANTLEYQFEFLWPNWKQVDTTATRKATKHSFHVVIGAVVKYAKNLCVCFFLEPMRCLLLYDRCYIHYLFHSSHQCFSSHCDCKQQSDKNSFALIASRQKGRIVFSQIDNACFLISAKITDVLTRSLQKAGGFPRQTFRITS